MTAPTKIKARGCSLSVGSALPGLESFEVGEKGNETFESTTLDGPVEKTKDPSGYADTPTIKATGYFDPTFIAAIDTLIAAPTTTTATVGYSNGGSQTYHVIGFKYAVKAEKGKAVMCDYTFETTGVYS
jgi:hypothetical protein